MIEFSKAYFKKFIFRQKCIPWRLKLAYAHVIVNLKIAFGKYYDKTFFDSELRKTLKDKTISIVCAALIEKYNPASIIDIGCGDGIYLEEFFKRGVEVFGCDNSREGLKRCRDKKLMVTKINIARDRLSLKRKYDIAICFEVAEHLPISASPKLVELVCKSSDIVIFTAAQPGQGGKNHINEQPTGFWIDKFNEMHYFLDIDDTEYLKNKWAINKVVDYMVRNLMIFKKGNYAES